MKRIKLAIRFLLPSKLYSLLGILKAIFLNRTAINLKEVNFIKNKNDVIVLLKTGVKKEHNPTISEMIYSSYRILKQHDVLNNYATQQNIKILNLSSYSFIDTYNGGIK